MFLLSCWRARDASKMSSEASGDRSLLLRLPLWEPNYWYADHPSAREGGRLKDSLWWVKLLFLAHVELWGKSSFYRKPRMDRAMGEMSLSLGQLQGNPSLCMWQEAATMGHSFLWLPKMGQAALPLPQSYMHIKVTPVYTNCERQKQHGLTCLGISRMGWAIEDGSCQSVGREISLQLDLCWEYPEIG